MKFFSLGATVLVVRMDSVVSKCALDSTRTAQRTDSATLRQPKTQSPKVKVSTSCAIEVAW